MKRSLLSLCALLLFVSPAAGQQPPATSQPAPAIPPAVKDQASYAIGLRIGGSLKKQKLELNLQKLAEGLFDAFSGAQPKLSDQQANAALEQFEKAMTAKTTAANKAFLAANKSKPGIVTLPSGLQYKVLKTGDGTTPKATDRVRTHYRGTLIDGTVFDSSYERKQPAVFPVNQVIGGWTEALQKMRVGDKWMLFVPAELGYGERGAGPSIGPNSTLIFEIELLGIE